MVPLMGFPQRCRVKLVHSTKVEIVIGAEHDSAWVMLQQGSVKRYKYVAYPQCNIQAIALAEIHLYKKSNIFDSVPSDRQD